MGLTYMVGIQAATTVWPRGEGPAPPPVEIFASPANSRPDSPLALHRAMTSPISRAVRSRTFFLSIPDLRTELPALEAYPEVRGS